MDKTVFANWNYWIIFPPRKQKMLWKYIIFNSSSIGSDYYFALPLTLFPPTSLCWPKSVYATNLRCVVNVCRSMCMYSKSVCERVSDLCWCWVKAPIVDPFASCSGWLKEREREKALSSIKNLFSYHNVILCCKSNEKVKEYNKVISVLVCVRVRTSLLSITTHLVLHRHTLVNVAFGLGILSSVASSIYLKPSIKQPIKSNKNYNIF